MKSIITFSLFLILFAIPSESQTWKKVEGTGSYINCIFIPENSGKLYVAADNVPTDLQQNDVQFPNYGVGQQGFRISSDKGLTFGDEILKDYSVFAFLTLPNEPNTMFASIRQFNESGIVKSTDGGKTWDMSDIHCINSSQVVNFAMSQGDASKIFAAAINTSKGYQFTLDTFNTCETEEQFVIEARDIVVSPHNPNLIFIGGYKSLHQVYRSYDNGVTWLNDESGLEGKRILCLMPSRWNEAVILAGVDSLDFNRDSHGMGIYMSTDTGKTWRPVGAAGKRVFDLAQHPTNPKYMVAACDSGSVFFSGSWGYGWEEYSHGLPADISVRVVAIADWGGDDGAVALAGTFGGGLYMSEKVITNIEDKKNSSIVNLRPNPATDYIEIVANNDEFNSQRTIKIYNVLGECVITSQLKNKGINRVNIDISVLPTGVYYVRAGNTIRKFVKY
jgi:hypothetical protein